MEPILRFLRALTRHPKTSAAGLASLAGVIIAAIARPEILADPGVWVALLTAIGLLLAADGRDDDRGGKPPGVPAKEERRPPRRKVIEMPSLEARCA